MFAWLFPVCGVTMNMAVFSLCFWVLKDNLNTFIWYDESHEWMSYAAQEKFGNLSVYISKVLCLFMDLKMLH